MSGWSLRTIPAEDGLRLHGHSLAAPDLARAADGSVWSVVLPPARREWWEDVGIAREEALDWRLEQGGGDVVLRVGGDGAELDVLTLSGEAARALDADDPEPLTLVGPYSALGGAGDLAAHLSARGPLLPAFGPGTRRISDQVALSLHGIARRRGGAFWDGLARWLEEWAGARSERLAAQPDLRYVTDLALLLIAAGEPAAAARALDELEACAAPLGGGRWYRHDREEVEAGRNDLVLNTHLHALAALAAAGRDVEPGQRALDHALALRAPRVRGRLLGARIALADAARAAGVPGAGALSWRLHERWAALRAEVPHLALTRGLLARDATPTAAPRYYRVVNLADLAGVVATAPTGPASSALRAGVRSARVSGFLRAERRAGEFATVIVPSLLLQAGHPRAAHRAATAARRAGWAPAIGWPGYAP